MLVGTVSIEKSEYLSDLLQAAGIKHEVLNAKQHEREAAIVAQAGQHGAVTIATNMAGRGTDIMLGEDVTTLGGLQIMGTERHESRRIDNQLRGRAGRQGDPGESRFFVSFEDDLMRRFAPEWLPGMMAKLGMEDNMPIEHSWVSKAIETAQKKVEGHNFDIRKNLVDYDDVMNKQRDVIYKERRKILEGADIKSIMLDMVEQELRELVGMTAKMTTVTTGYRGIAARGQRHRAAVPRVHRSGVWHDARTSSPTISSPSRTTHIEAREEHNGPDGMRILERLVMLQTIDRLWVEHLTAMDEMRQGIGLQAYGQTDPLVAYKREALDMFDQLMANIRNNVARNIYHIEFAPSVVAVPVAPNPAALQENRDEIEMGGGDNSALGDPSAPASATAGRAQSAAASAPAGGVAVMQKVGRNDPCPCGSGRKYKRCHGA